MSSSRTASQQISQTFNLSSFADWIGSACRLTKLYNRFPFPTTGG